MREPTHVGKEHTNARRNAGVNGSSQTKPKDFCTWAGLGRFIHSIPYVHVSPPLELPLKILQKSHVLLFIK